MPGSGASRADMLIFVENKGKASATATAQRTARGEANNYRGRY